MFQTGAFQHVLNFEYSNLFRISIFEFRISFIKSDFGN